MALTLILPNQFSFNMDKASKNKACRRRPLKEELNSERRMYMEVGQAKQKQQRPRCAERAYSPAKLGGNVEWIPFTDHNPAPVDIMLFFCERAGRTGVMICAYLLYTRESSDPVSAMDYYGERRTKNGKGVTIPSQKRYIFYFNEIIQHGPRHTPALQLLQVILNSNVLLKYDAHLRISCNGGNGSYQLSPVLDTESLLFYFWFNTAFIEGDTLYLMSKLDLDKPFKNLEIDTQARLLFFPNLKTIEGLNACRQYS